MPNLGGFVQHSLVPALTGGLTLERTHGHGPNVARLYLWLALLVVPLSFQLVRAAFIIVICATCEAVLNRG